MRIYYDTVSEFTGDKVIETKFNNHSDALNYAVSNGYEMVGCESASDNLSYPTLYFKKKVEC